MTPLKRSSAIISILALVALACSLSLDLGAPQLVSPNQVPTMVAQTIQVLRQEAEAATATNTPSPSPTPIPTNTPAGANLSVSQATTCYAGPSTGFGRVITIYPGVTVSVVGKDTADNYWIIDVPGYPGTVCWISGQYAQVTGDIAGLPSPAKPVIPTYTLSEPRNLHISCSSSSESDDEVEWTVVLSWKNTDPDQSRVRIFRNGRLIDTVGAHASSFTDDFDVSGHRRRGVTYGVQAYSNRAVSSIVTVSLHDCD